MLLRGRSWATGVFVACAALSTGPLVAAQYFPVRAENAEADAKPLITPAPLRGKDRAFGGHSLPSAVPSIPNYSQSGPSEVPSGRFERRVPQIDGLTLPPQMGGAGSDAVNPAGWSEPNAAPARALAAQTPGNWVAVVGAVARPGCYELSARSIAVAELMEKCGGLTRDASGTLAVVRDGRALGLAYNPQDRLLGGDVIVVAEKGMPQSRVATTGLNPMNAGASSGVQLGLVNVLDRPVPVLVPASHASVAGVLAIANQNQLRPDDIKVVMGGTEEVFGDQTSELTPGSVLVFPPGAVDPATLGGVKTRFYPAAQRPGIEPAPMYPEPSLRLLDETALGAPGGLSELPNGAAMMSPPADFAGSTSTGDLSSIPSVEMLDAPAGDTLRFPRTADASGAIPVGAPEAGSHIVPFPTDPAEPSPVTGSSTPSAEASAAMATAATTPVAPTPVTLSESAETDADTASLPAFTELAPTLLIGSILGAVTFWGLRQWRMRRLHDAIAGRLTAMPKVFGRPKATRPVELRVHSPDQMLAALIANRLALREEAVALSPAMQIYGRSPAMKHRRIDPPTAELPRPHIPLAASRSQDNEVETASMIGGREADIREADVHGAGIRGAGLRQKESDREGRFRIDDAESAAVANAAHVGSTPFERALAAMRDGRRS